jgi:putative effector of murein hydrolase LrgA (UPF0299 family)
MEDLAISMGDRTELRTFLLKNLMLFYSPSSCSIGANISINASFFFPTAVILINFSL